MRRAAAARRLRGRAARGVARDARGLAAGARARRAERSRAVHADRLGREATSTRASRRSRTRRCRSSSRCSRSGSLPRSGRPALRLVGHPARARRRRRSSPGVHPAGGWSGAAGTLRDRRRVGLVRGRESLRGRADGASAARCSPRRRCSSAFARPAAVRTARRCPRTFPAGSRSARLVALGRARHRARADPLVPDDRHATARRARCLVTYMLPAFALFYGAVFLCEPLTLPEARRARADPRRRRARLGRRGGSPRRAPARRRRRDASRSAGREPATPTSCSS